MSPDLSSGLAAGQYSQPAGGIPNFQTPVRQTGGMISDLPQGSVPVQYNYPAGANPPIQTGATNTNILQGQYSQPAGGNPNFETPSRPMGCMINPI
jgi:hypothetical protein